MAECVFRCGTKEIRLADKAGFCFGVRNAVEKVEALLDECAKTGERVFATGNLIHNRTVIEELAAKGLRTVKTPAEAEPGSRILVRAHGEGAPFYRAAEAAGLKIEDMTCPFVAKIHTIVREAHESGRGVLIIGDAMHPEVAGIRGWAGEPCKVVATEEEAGAFAERYGKPGT
ncbi:MAG: 4-hydroxy-3-methylbut-2-enyl diphosphate reductase, partial [Firmicutes bacterium]|nr:4-hydroxy-3-methylbut-2-enyl diphosphate reductase [Bacillota bacterium]